MAVTAKNIVPRYRAAETSRKEGITFGDLCELVDKGRDANIDSSAPVLGDTWITNKVKDRDGYRLRWIEV